MGASGRDKRERGAGRESTGVVACYFYWGDPRQRGGEGGSGREQTRARGSPAGRGGGYLPASKRSGAGSGMGVIRCAPRG